MTEAVPAGPLLNRLAKGERVPVTLELQPLVDSALAGRKGSGQHSLEDKQVCSHSTGSTVKS